MVWHRMGDMGYFDDLGRLWFCGRKAHRVLMPRGKVLYSVCVEAPFDAAMREVLAAEKLDSVQDVRTALVGIGQPGAQKAVIVVEMNDELDDALLDRFDAPTEVTALDAFEKWFDGSAFKGEVAAVLCWPGLFPVDVRHNAKINREKLAVWAAAAVKSQEPRAESRSA